MSITNLKPNVKTNWVYNVKSNVLTSGGDFVSLTTIHLGLFTATITGTNGTSLWFDWGEGGALEEFEMTGAPVACSHTYGDASSKTIKITGDLTDVTVLDCIAQDLTDVNVVAFSSLISLYLNSQASLAMSIEQLTSLTSLTVLNLYNTVAVGSVAALSTLTSLVYLRLYNTNATGSVAALSTLPSLLNLRVYNTDVSMTNEALPPWAGCVIQCNDCAWTTQEVDWFLVNMADGVGAGGAINIAGDNGARTQPDTDAAVAAIIAAGRALTVNE